MPFGSGGSINSSTLGRRTRQRRGFSAQQVQRPGRISLARPTYDPIDMTGINTLQKRISDADRTAGDPLSAPGVQAQLGVISEGLNRQFASEKGSAMSRAAQSGQAGFGGAFSQTSANLSGQLASTRAQEQSDMMMEVYQRARAEGLSATEAMTSAQSEVARIKNERSRIDADLAAQEAELNQRAEERYRNDVMEQARLAEDARQFDSGADLEGDKFDFARRESDLDRLSDRERFEYDKKQDLESSSFRKRGEARQAELDARQLKLDDEELKRNTLQSETSLLGSLYDNEVIERDTYTGELDERYPNFGLQNRFSESRFGKKWRKEDAFSGGRGFKTKKRREN